MAAGGRSRSWDAGLDFLLVGGGGIVVGLVLAFVILPLWGRLRDPSIQITFSVLIPYGVYILAEEILHVSGILAVVTYGLVQGWQAAQALRRRLHAHPGPSRSGACWSSSWRRCSSSCSASSSPSIVGKLEEYSVAEVLLYAVLVYGVVLGARLAFFFTVPYLHPVFDRLFRSRYLRGTWREYLVMSWSGMRGAVSLAAALTVPIVRGRAAARPGRDLILFITFSVILGHPRPARAHPAGPHKGPAPARRTGAPAGSRSCRPASQGARAALDRLERICEENGLPPDTEQGMREYYEDRIQRYEAGIEAGGITDEYAESSAAWRKWRRDLISAERDAVVAHARRRRDQPRDHAPHRTRPRPGRVPNRGLGDP